MVEAVSKSRGAADRLQALGIQLPPAEFASPRLVAPFAPASEVYRAMEGRLAAFDLEPAAKRAITEGVDHRRERV
jgi:hypothetical protein